MKPAMLRPGTSECLEVQVITDVDPTHDPVYFATTEILDDDVPDNAWQAGTWHPDKPKVALTPLVGDTQDAVIQVERGETLFLVIRIDDSPEAPAKNCGAVRMP